MSPSGISGTLTGSKTVRNNIIANLAGRVWAAFSSYLFVPFYLKLLGGEAYGLVGFFATLSAILMLADFGISATLSRELARVGAKDETQLELGNIVRTFETIAAVCMISLGAATWLASPIISTRWLNIADGSLASATLALQLMSLALPLQLMSQLYTGGLMGRERQVEANLIQAGGGLARGLLTIAALVSFAPTIEVYAASQLVASSILCVVARRQLISSIPSRTRVRFSWQIASTTAKYSLAMGGMTCVSVLLTQMDKLIVSRSVSLEQLGHYTIAAMFAGVPKLFAVAIGAGAFPRMTAMVALGRDEELRALYYRCSCVVAVLVVPVAINLGVFADSYLSLWTRSHSVADSAGIAALYMIVGETLQAVLLVPYYLALAYGAVGANLVLALVSAVFLLPALVLLVERCGITGAGASWALVNVATLPVYIFYLHRRYRLGNPWRWYWGALVAPAAVVTPISASAAAISKCADDDAVGIVIPIGALVLSLAACIGLVPEVRGAVLRIGRWVGKWVV